MGEPNWRQPMLEAHIARLRQQVAELREALIYVVNVGSGEAKRHALETLRKLDGEPDG